MLKKLFFLLLCLPLIIFANEKSQNGTDTTKVYPIDPVVVTGTRVTQEKSRIPFSLSVINIDGIEASSSMNILTLLNDRVPGLFINERNTIGSGAGDGSAGNISIRGISGTPNTNILVLIDGQPQFMGIFGHPFADSYLTSDIEKVEVIRGPASVLYGSNAFGGAINFITRKQKEDKLSAGAKLSYGSFNTKEITLSTGIKKDNYNFLVTFNNASTDGYRDNADDQFKTTSGYMNAGLVLNPNFRLSLDGNISDSKFYDPGTEAAPMRGSFYKYLRTRGALSLINTFENIEGAFKLYLNYGHNTFFDGWDSKDYTGGLTFYQGIKFSTNTIVTAGIDYKKYGGKGTNTILPFVLKGLNEDHWIDETEFYLLAEQIINDKLILNAGYRLTGNSVYGSEHTPEAGFSYIIDQNSVVKGSVGKAFRSPTVTDLYLFPVSNADLKPEHLWNYELSYSRSLFEKRISLEVTGFYCEGDNMIQTVASIQGVPPQKINTGSFINKGVEFQGNAAITAGLNVSLNYSYLNTSTAQKAAPEHQVNLHGSYNISRYHFSVDIKKINGLYSDIVNKIKTDFTRIDAKFGYDFTKWFTAYIKAENLLDEKYQIDYGYPVMPASVFVGVDLKY